MPLQKIGVEDVTELFNPSGECVKRSAEVRWFVAGSFPTRVSAWFTALGPGRLEPHRTDVYLVTPDPSLNVKQREGRLEVKRRDTVEGAVNLRAGTAGRVERWEKWIVPAPPDLEAKLGNGDDAFSWVGVGKARQLQSFTVNDKVHPIPVYADKERGCNVELTRLTVGRERWWTLCFEAFGPEEELTDLLTRTVKHVFAEHAPNELTLEHSYGYAQWLMHRIESVDEGSSPTIT